MKCHIQKWSPNWLTCKWDPASPTSCSHPMSTLSSVEVQQNINCWFFYYHWLMTEDGHLLKYNFGIKSSCFYFYKHLTRVCPTEPGGEKTFLAAAEAEGFQLTTSDCLRSCRNCLKKKKHPPAAE